jgi:hypothetical protein
MFIQSTKEALLEIAQALQKFRDDIGRPRMDLLVSGFFARHRRRLIFFVKAFAKLQRLFYCVRSPLPTSVFELNGHELNSPVPQGSIQVP